WFGIGTKAPVACIPEPVPGVRSESGYFRNLERRCGDGTEGEVDRRDHRLLREAEVRIAQGETAGKICRGAGISEQTYYKWRRGYGGMNIHHANRLKEREREKERLKKAVSELTLDKQILKEALSGKY